MVIGPLFLGERRRGRQAGQLRRGHAYWAALPLCGEQQGQQARPGQATLLVSPARVYPHAPPDSPAADSWRPCSSPRRTCLACLAPPPPTLTAFLLLLLLLSCHVHAELGVHPQVASATSNVMVLISASSAAASCARAGRLNLEYAAVFGSICLVRPDT